MTRSQELEQRLLDEIMRIQVIDVHSHVPADAPFARSLRELLGYHYFTELAYSAGMDRSLLEPETPDEVMLPALVEALAAADNTVQYGWAIELARELFGFQHSRLTRENWQELAEAVRGKSQRPGREREILERSSIEKVFLTNEFNEDLGAIDRSIFVPSLRADALVQSLDDPSVRSSLEEVTDVALRKAADLRDALEKLMRYFKDNGAASVSVSLPPQFRLFPVVESDLDTAVGKAAQKKPLSSDERATLRCGVFFALADLCGQLELPMQVMYGVVRGAYRHGVHQGTDLPQAGDTLRSLVPLLNTYPQVTCCLSVLSDSQAQELACYGWMVRSVVVSGHWWYDTFPAYLERDLSARLQCVPKTKLIGYYSDMYKLEFGLPKFNMFRRVLAKVLAHDLVASGRGAEDDAIAVARCLLRENALRIFGV